MDATTQPLGATGRLLSWIPFRRYWFSRLASQTAQAALLYGLLILLVDRTDSGLWPAVFVVCSIVPSLLLGLVGGAIADYVPQRALLVVLNLLRAGVVLWLVIDEVSLTAILITTIAIWSLHQFYSPAESALIARLVEGPRIAAATSLYNLALSLAQLLGMVVMAPLLLKLTRVDVLLTMCALLYLSASVALIGMGRTPVYAPAGEHEPVTERVSRSLRTGWRFLVRDRASFAALVDSVLLGIGMSALVVIIPQYMERVLSTGADNTVYVFAPAAFGLVAGLQVAPLMGAIIGHGRLATLGLITFALCVAGIGLVEQIAPWLSDRGLLVGWLESKLGLPERISTTMMLALPAGMATAVVNVASRTVLLQRSPADVRARVFATQMTLANLGALAPTLLAGVLIDLVGVPPVAMLFAFALVLGAILARRIGGETRSESAHAGA